MDRLEKGRAAEARYSGRCALCGRGFEAGEKIWKSRQGEKMSLLDKLYEFTPECYYGARPEQRAQGARWKAKNG